MTITGKVVPDESGGRTFWVQFVFGEEILAQWPVPSLADGKREMIAALTKLHEEKRHEMGWG